MIAAVVGATPALALQCDLAGLPVPALGPLAIAAALGLVACLVFSHVAGSWMARLSGREVHFTVFAGCALYFFTLGVLPNAVLAQLVAIMGR